MAGESTAPAASAIAAPVLTELQYRQDSLSALLRIESLLAEIAGSIGAFVEIVQSLPLPPAFRGGLPMGPKQNGE
jgi:hypothetical protein